MDEQQSYYQDPITDHNALFDQQQSDLPYFTQNLPYFTQNLPVIDQQQSITQNIISCDDSPPSIDNYMINRRCRWTPELHAKFVEVVNQLGGPQKATPKYIQFGMKVRGLTLFQIKSHLQKYRLGRPVKGGRKQIFGQWKRGGKREEVQAHTRFKLSPPNGSLIIGESSSTPRDFVNDPFINLSQIMCEPTIINSIIIGESSSTLRGFANPFIINTDEMINVPTIEEMEQMLLSFPEPQPPYQVHDTSLFSPAAHVGNMGTNVGHEGSMNVDTFSSWNPNLPSLTSHDLEAPSSFVPDFTSIEEDNDYNYLLEGLVSGDGQDEPRGFVGGLPTNDMNIDARDGQDGPRKEEGDLITDFMDFYTMDDDMFFGDFN